ncbi:MAG TPA: DUF116 domain-containing protein [Candidatus Cloacimonetes bacterium]|nr:DUF116 domain-containing protein [Candidatus Cloacimonadota bacterium]HEX37384.1 DUF116 domain-containing protein [Candidatus Cloacimonadota bacterium]
MNTLPMTKKPTGKALFLWLSTISLILLMIAVTLLWYFISPRLHEFNEAFPFILLTGLRIFFFILVIGSILVLLTALTERNFIIARFAVHLFIKIMYPICVFMSSLVGIKEELIGESFVKVNDTFIRSMRKKFKAKDVLILLPHCLQSTECKIRITTDPSNCIRCMKCDIGKVLKLAEKYNVEVAIATGGTLARRIIIDKKPNIIIAVACYRDLVSGIRDTYPIMTMGILNLRPEGPCINTKVEIDKLQKTLDSIVLQSN